MPPTIGLSHNVSEERQHARKGFDHLLSVTQRPHALRAHWGLWCEDDAPPGDPFHQGGRFHAASLRDFLAVSLNLSAFVDGCS